MSGSFFFCMVRHARRLPHYTVTRWQLRRLLTRQNILIADVIILPSLRLIPEPTSQRLWEKWTMRKLQNCHFTAHTVNTEKTCLFCNKTSFSSFKNKNAEAPLSHIFDWCLTIDFMLHWHISLSHVSNTGLMNNGQTEDVWTRAAAFNNANFCYSLPLKSGKHLNKCLQHQIPSIPHLIRGY